MVNTLRQGRSVQSVAMSLEQQENCSIISSVLLNRLFLIALIANRGLFRALSNMLTFELFPNNIFLFKVAIETLEKSVKYVQSQQ